MPLNPPGGFPPDGFESFPALHAFTNAQAKEQGYSIVKRRPSNYKNGISRRYDVSCVAGGQAYRSVSTGQRRVTTKKTSCPWKAKALQSATNDRWFFYQQDARHNHNPIQPKAKRASRTRRVSQDTPHGVETDTLPAIVDSEMSTLGEVHSSTPTVSGPPDSTTRARSGEQHGEAQLELWGNRILSAINDQGRLLRDLAQGARDGPGQTPHPSTFEPHEGHDDMETMSRNDVPWTPITGADNLLSWGVFPQEKPVSTLPASAHDAKPNPYMNGTPRAPTQYMFLKMLGIEADQNPQYARNHQGIAGTDIGTAGHVHGQV